MENGKLITCYSFHRGMGMGMGMGLTWIERAVKFSLAISTICPRLNMGQYLSTSSLLLQLQLLRQSPEASSSMFRLNQNIYLKVTICLWVLMFSISADIQAQKMQNFVSANISYLQYTALEFVNPVPFPHINHKIQYS